PRRTLYREKPPKYTLLKRLLRQPLFYLITYQTLQIRAITRFHQWLCKILQLLFVYIPHTKSYFFDRADLGSRTFFYHLYKLRRLQQRLDSPGIQPGCPTVKHADFQLATFQIGLIDIGYFYLASLRRLYILGDFNHLVIIKIKPWYGKVRFWRDGLFFDGQHRVIFIKFYHAIPLRISDRISENNTPIGI